METIRRSTRFFKEAYIELKNCTWLAPKQVALSTWAVIILVFIISIYMASVDRLISWFFQWVI